MRLTRRSVLAGALLAAPRLAYANEAAATPAWPSALTMGTGRPGGAYALYGPEWGRLAAAASGVSMAYRASGGSAANILLIEQGDAQLGMSTLTVAAQARTGSGNWTAGVKFDSFRALFPMFPSILQIVTPRATGIMTLAGLADRAIGIGPDGGSGAAAVPGILASIGILPSRIVTGDYTSQIRDMLAGKLAACAFIAAPPVPAIAIAAAGTGLALIGFSRAELAKVVKTAPGLSEMLLPAGQFPGQFLPVASLGTANFSIGAASLPNSLVTALTLAALRHRAALDALVPAASAMPPPQLIMQAEIPFHPGAAIALRSLGLQVPAQFVQG